MIPSIKYPPLPPRSGFEILDIVAHGNCQQLREHFDQAFWAVQRVSPSWEHLKIAVARGDKPMAQLLVTWGARPAAGDLERLKQEVAGNKYPQCIKLLRQCGLPVSAATIAEAGQEKPPEEEKAEAVKNPENLKAGDVAADGSIYLGHHQDKDWFVTREDATKFNWFVTREDGRNLTMHFNQAAEYAKNLQAHGHHDWVVPDKDILNEMFNNKSAGAFKGTYNESGDRNYGWYWTSTQGQDNPGWPWRQMFRDGNREWTHEFWRLSVRCVRSVPRPRPGTSDTGPR